MLVSIIIPCFNAVTTLCYTIESALNQMHTDKEVIVVDDGSTDSSVQVALHYGSDIRLIKQNNQGPATARNTGIAAARGEFILPLDADDKISPTYLMRTLSEMKPGIDIVSTGMQYFGIANDYIPIKVRTYEQQLQSNEIPVTSLIRKNAIVGGYPEETPGWEDWFCWLNMLANGSRMVAIDEPLFWYRRRQNHFGSTAWDRKVEFTKIIREKHPKFLEGQL